MATELGKAFVQIVPSAQGITGSISSVLNPEADSAGESAGKKIGTKLVSFVKTAITAGAIGKTFKDALLAGGDIEQSVGGVKKIFGDAAQSMIDNAQVAYRTAGISANSYMEQATSFSAALVSSLGGDTGKAAKIADMAIIDMADNVNTYGSNMQDVQNAYQGFAKQNYTMLDNLKLGYGGTKSEMERLLQDAEKLTGVKYDINNLSDVYSAIHAIQQETHISGTTANEAAGTIAGSMGMLKASFADLQGLMALSGNQSAEEFGLSWTNALKNVISSMGNVAKNVIPALQSVASTLPTVLVEAVTAGLPMIVNGGLQIITSLVQGVTSALPVLMQKGPEMIQSILTSIVNGIPQLIASGAQLITAIANGVITGLPQLSLQIAQLVPKLVQGLAESGTQLIQAGLGLIFALSQGLIQAIPSLVAMVPTIVQTLLDFFIQNAVTIVTAGLEITMALLQGIMQALPAILAALPEIFTAMQDSFTGFDWATVGGTIIELLVDGIDMVFDMLPDILRLIAETGAQLMERIDWVGLGSTVINFIARGISALVRNIPDILGSIARSGLDMFAGIDWLGLGRDVVLGIVNGIAGMGGVLFDTLLNLASSALNAAKRFLGIGSPSRLFRDKVGKWIPAGMAEGIRENMGAVQSEMTNLSDLASGTYTTDIMANATMAAPAVATAGAAPVYNYNYEINVSGENTANTTQLAIRIRDEIVRLEKRGY